MKTIKQIADELGVSKTAVRNQIENLGLRSSLQKNGNQFAINETQESLIKSAFFKKESQTTYCKPVCDESESLRLLNEVIFTLREQLAQKDKQIEELNKRLAEATEAYREAQTSANTAQALHAGTIQHLLETPKKRGLFDVFRRK